MLPVLEIDGRPYVVDLRAREFRAVDEPSVRITADDLAQCPDEYAFGPRMVDGLSVTYARDRAGKLLIDVPLAGDAHVPFERYPIEVRLRVRCELAGRPTPDEIEKMEAAAMLAPVERLAVWEDLLCRRAEGIELEHQKYTIEMAGALKTLFISGQRRRRRYKPHAMG